MRCVRRVVFATRSLTHSFRYLGEGGAGNYVKMVHNGIEYGDMQLISEAYDLLKSAGMNNEEIADVFEEWNKGELQSFLIEITFKILRKKDEDVMVWSDSTMLPKQEGYVVDTVSGSVIAYLLRE